MIRRFRMLLALVVALGWLAPAQAETMERRVALVIGNADYVNVDGLKNPANDAREMAAALERLGFEVELGLDLDKPRMDDTLRRFARMLGGAEVALFFYAGHGLQVQGRNYLAPVDTKLEYEADVLFETVPLEHVLVQLEREPRVSLVFLDACRDNPLARRLARAMGAARSTAVGRGLAEVRAGLGTLIAYATEPNAVALDGRGDNSPFTMALLEHIETPGLEVRQMLSRVRDEVIRMTDGEQVPWDHSSLRTDFYFKPALAPEPEPQLVERTAPAAPGLNLEVVFWQSIQNSRNSADFRAYLDRFGEGLFAPLARNRLQELEAERMAALPSAPERPEVAKPTIPAEVPPPRAAEPPPAVEPAEQRTMTPEIEIEPLDVEYVATTSANVRAGPATDAERVGTLKNGERVIVTGKVEGQNWYRIDRDGEVAYVHASLLEEPRDEPVAPPPERAPAEPAPSAPPAATPAPQLPPSEPLPRDDELAVALFPLKPAPAISEADQRPNAGELAGKVGTSSYSYGNACSNTVEFTRWRDVPTKEARISFAGSMERKLARIANVHGGEGELAINKRSPPQAAGYSGVHPSCSPQAAGNATRRDS